MPSSHEKEELRAMLMAIEQEKGQLTLVSEAGLEKLLDRMLKNYGEEGPEGLGVSRENALTAMKRYRAWLKHEEMIERLVAKVLTAVADWRMSQEEEE
jgi:hypothetical protein